MSFGGGEHLCMECLSFEVRHDAFFMTLRVTDEASTSNELDAVNKELAH